MGYSCPAHYNPADFVIEVCSRTASDKLRTDGLFLTQKESSHDLAASVVSSDEAGVVEVCCPPQVRI